VSALEWSVVAGLWAGHVTAPLFVWALEEAELRLHRWRHRNDPPPDSRLVRQFEAHLKEPYAD
jgi:hypothetical protein